MLSADCLRELRSSWLPNITGAGLERLIDLLEKGSPLLTSGCFTRAVPMGCLASHVAWNHPRTGHLTLDAGINWLHRVAGLNPATSQVIREWDTRGSQNWEMRAELLAELRSERDRRQRANRRGSRLSEPVADVRAGTYDTADVDSYKSKVIS
jgi:hypothetical protein